MSLREPENIPSVPANGQTLTFRSTKLFLKNVAHYSENIVMSGQPSCPVLNYHHPIRTLIKMSPCFPKAQSCRDNYTRDSLQRIWNCTWHYKKYASWWHQAILKLHREVLRKIVVEPSALRTAALERYREWGDHLQATLLSVALGIPPLATSAHFWIWLRIPTYR